MKCPSLAWNALAFAVGCVIAQNLAAAERRPQAIPAKEPLYANQKNALGKINLESAWDITQGNSSVTIAIIDDAIDIDHPDLAANMLSGKNFLDNGSDVRPGISDCSGSTTVYDDHGTSVAGVIGAVGDNATGIAGINWRVSLLPLKVGCQYSANPEAQALGEAIRRGATAINMSYGGMGRQWPAPQVSTLAAANVLLVAAAGNQNNNNDYVPFFPANEPLSNLLSVAAVDANNNLTPWTHYGQTTVALAAPGSGVYTTLYDPSRATHYGAVSGTSMSAPIVSGIAALIKAAYPNATARDLKGAMLASVTPLAGNVTAKLMTDGVVNARGALDAMKAPVPVLLVRGIKVVDGAAGNGELDPRETAALSLTLENAWVDASAVALTLKSGDAHVSIPTPSMNLGAVAAGESKKVDFQITLSDFVGHQRFPFSLDITAGGKLVTRRFVVETGPLISGQPFQTSIQQDDFDEAHFYHLNVPANPNLSPSKLDFVAFEVDYTVANERDIDLIVAPEQRPIISVGDFNPSSYDYSKYSRYSFSTDGRAGFERAEFPTDGRAITAHAMVVNFPEADLTKPYAKNKPYTIRACYVNQSDGGTPPIANVGADITVEPGDEVTLSGSGFDTDAGGRVVSRWWAALAGAPRLNSYKTDAPKFTAPDSGTFTFSYSVSDDTCRVGSDSVTVKVREAADAVEGLALYPSSGKVEAGGNYSQVVQGSINSISVRNLTVESKPTGVNFDSTTGLLTWQNVKSPGRYIVTFSARDSTSNARFTADYVITVVDRAATSNAQGISRGGCTLGKSDEIDPMLPLFAVISLLFLLRCKVNSK